MDQKWLVDLQWGRWQKKDDSICVHPMSCAQGTKTRIEEPQPSASCGKRTMAAGKLLWDHGELAVFIGKWPFTAARSLLQTLLLSWYQLVWYDRPRSLRQSFVQKDAISTQVDEKLAVSWNEKPSTWMGKINPKNGCIQIFQRTNLLWLQASVKSLQRVHSRPTRVAGAERGQLLLRFNLSTS